MPTRQQRLLALLATARAANLPTVATHVVVAFLLAHDLYIGLSQWRMFAFALFPIVLAAMLYTGGCLLGDAVDAHFDAAHRPDRPIPQGILSARFVVIAGGMLLFTAWFLSGLLPLAIHGSSLGMPMAEILHAIRSIGILPAFPWQYLALCSALALAIVIYARSHKSLGAGAPVLMALCRALLVLWAGSILTAVEYLLYTHFRIGSPIVLYAGATFLYTLTLSLVARTESDPDAKLPSRPIRLLFVLSPLVLVWSVSFTTGVATSALAPTVTQITLGIFSLLYLAWCTYALTRLKHSIPAFVSAALAGFCLMDACFAALVGWPVALACLALFLLALLLQRIAPAT